MRGPGGPPETAPEPDAPATSVASPSRRSRVLTTAGLVALAGVATAAGFLAAFEWNRVVDYRSPYVFEAEPGAAGPRLADRVVLFVVDGLRADEAEALPTFQSLGEQGSFLVSRTSQPSLSLPGWTALTAGAPPDISGVTTNWYEGPVQIDSVLDAAARSGLTTAVAGSESWEQLYGDVVGRGFYAPEEEETADREIGRQARRLLRDAPDLLVVHLPDVDKRGHESGVGAAYREAAARADGIIARIVESAGPNAAFLLTSDHGHIDEGGHGGPETEATRTPLVLFGEGLVPGARGEVEQLDVAPTVAALLGLPRPAQSVGTLRVELLDASDEERAGIEEADREVAARFYERATAVVGGEGRAKAAFESARDERLRHDLLARLPIALAVIAAMAIALTVATQRLDGVAMALGAAAFLAAWAALFFGRGLTLSLSRFNTEDQVRSFLVGRSIDSLVAIVVAGLVAGLVAGRRQRAGAFRTGVGVAAWIMFVLGLGVTAFLTIFGWGYTWRLPHLSAALAQFLAVLAIVSVGITAGLTGLVAAGTARLVRPRPG